MHSSLTCRVRRVTAFHCRPVSKYFISFLCLTDVNWMDDATRQLAKEKLSMITNLIGRLPT